MAGEAVESARAAERVKEARPSPAAARAVDWRKALREASDRSGFMQWL